MASSSTTKISARELLDISSSDSDETRPVIVLVALFPYTCVGGASEKSDLIIGNESDSGYDCNSLYTYEIFIVACSPCGLFVGLML